MLVTYTMQTAMQELKKRLADVLDDDYPDVRDEILTWFCLTDEEETYVLKNYLDSGDF